VGDSTGGGRRKKTLCRGKGGFGGWGVIQRLVREDAKLLPVQRQLGMFQKRGDPTKNNPTTEKGGGKKREHKSGNKKVF